MSKEETPHSGIESLRSIPGIGIVDAAGVAQPADGSAGFAPGCLYRDYVNGVVYINEGSLDSSDFDAITTA